MQIFGDREIPEELEESLAQLEVAFTEAIKLNENVGMNTNTSETVAVALEPYIKKIKEVAQSLTRAMRNWRSTCSRCGGYSDREPYCNCI